MQFNPASYPPFPDDANPRTQLETISLIKLINGDEKERARVFDICRTKGFFFLDFSNSHAASLPEDAEDIARMSEPLFALSQDEKMSHGLGECKSHSLLGYKSSGVTKTDSTGTSDTAEFWNIGKDDMLETPGSIRVKYPSRMESPETKCAFGDFQASCHRVGLEIMSIIAECLDLPPDAFTNKHRINKPSDDHVRITRAPPRASPDMSEIQTPGHTDFGLITILFNWLGGLQIWSEPSRGNFHQVFDGAQPQENGRVAEWLWVKPKPGCAIVDLGDAAVKFTGGLLCSARHRVVPPPGEQGMFPRYSVVYFVRPEDDAVLKRLEGGMVPKAEVGHEEPEFTMREWIQKQYLQLREGKERSD